MKIHWRELTNEPFLGHWDLETDVIVTIDSITTGEVVGPQGKEDKPLLKFKEYAKPMICNKTNFSRLEKRFKTGDYNGYIGKTVVLGVEKTKSPNGLVDCLRVKSNPPVAPKKETLSDERLAKAIESKYSTEKLLAKYELTPAQKKQYGL